MTAPWLSFVLALVAFVQALTIPSPTGQVNDFANVVPAAQRARIEAIARQVRERSRGEIAVVTLADIGPREAGDVALQMRPPWLRSSPGFTRGGTVKSKLAGRSSAGSGSTVIQCQFGMATETASDSL